MDQLRDAIVAAPADDRVLPEASSLLRRAEFARARDRVLDGMPGWFLSPAAHNLLALAHRGTGNEDAAAGERALSGLGLRIILDSGTGSRLQPWTVLRVSDEYDLAMLNQKRVAGQSTPDGTHDSLVCSDGTTYWFRLHRPARTAAA